MAVFKLHELPRPDSRQRPILETELEDEGFVYLWSTGPLDLACGVCGHILVRGTVEARPDRIVFPEKVLHGGFVFYCNRCRSYNEIRRYL